MAFGLLSSHSRLHGSDSYRVPWAFDEQAVEVLRKFTRLKLSLMPYLVGVAEEAHSRGVPMMRPMLLEFPDDPTSAMLERQYMLGPDLLVAPVMSADGEVTYYVPEGTWTSLLTGDRVTGPRWITERHDIDSLPLLVRPGAVLPVGRVHDRPDYDWAEGLRLRVFSPELSRTSLVEVPDGRGGTTARIEVIVADGSARARLVSGEATYEVEVVA